jgi:hypothetical protein
MNSVFREKQGAAKKAALAPVREHARPATTTAGTLSLVSGLSASPENTALASLKLRQLVSDLQAQLAKLPPTSRKKANTDDPKAVPVPDPSTPSSAPEVPDHGKQRPPPPSCTNVDAAREEKRFKPARALQVKPEVKSFEEPLLSRRIVQVGGLLHPIGGDVEESVRRARNMLLDWLKEQKVDVPQLAYSGQGFEFDETSTRQPVSVEVGAECWAMQFDKPERNRPSRVWRTEAVLYSKERALIGIGLTLLDPTGVNDFRGTSIPRIIRTITDKIGLWDDGVVLSATPRRAHSEEDVTKLIELLERKGRSRAVIVVSRDERDRGLLDADELARRLAGVAHIYDLRFEASRELTRQLGKELSVFGSAVRVYRPGFDSEAARSFHHPLFLHEAWHLRSRSLATRLDEIATEETARTGDDAVPTFGIVRRWISERRIREAREAAVSDSSELLELLEHENARLTRELKEAWDHAIAVDQDASIAKTRALEHEELILQLKTRIRWLEDRLKAATGADVVPPPSDFPDTWDGLEKWVDERLAGKVFVLPSAAKAARRSAFEDIPFCYRVLEMLGEIYQPMRSEGGTEHRKTLDTACAELHVDISPVGSAATAHRTRDAYRAQWKGRRVVLDMHVKGSNSRKQQEGFRLYFHYDEEEQIVVVGSFPVHLDSTLS